MNVRMFANNQYEAIETQSMNVIPYTTQDIRQDHPYHRYNDVYDTLQAKIMLQKLVAQGTLSQDGPMEEPSLEEITTPLKDHQKRLVWEMKRYENCPFQYSDRARVGYLCDEVGAGKSLTLLSLISQNKGIIRGGRSMRAPFINPIRNYSNYPKLPKPFNPDAPNASYRRIPSTLIVVPHTIYTQWKIYIERDTKLTHYYIHTKKKVNDFLEEIQKEAPEYTDLVLIKSSQYNYFIERMNEIQETQVDCEEYIPETSSNDYSIQKVQEIVRALRAYNRHLNILQQDYNRGNETIQSISQEITEINELLETNKSHLESVNSMDNQNPGKLVQTVYIPKSGFVWDRVIVDEADTIPISNQKSIMSRMFWIVSASYASFIYPSCSPHPQRKGFFRELTESQKHMSFYIQYAFFRNKESTILNAFPLPQVQEQIVECYTPNHVRMAYASNLRNVIDAVNAGDTEEALRLAHVDQANDSNGLIETLRNNLTYQLEQWQHKKDRYNNLLENCNRNISEMQEQVSGMNQQISSITDPNELHHISELTESIRIMMRNSQNYEQKMLTATQTIQSLQSRIESMQEKIEESMEDDCPICMEEIAENKRAILKCCNAAICVDCVMQQISSYRDRTSPCPCPMCRAKLTTEDFTVIRKSVQSRQAVETLLTKKQQVISILERNEDSRILLFSGYDTTFIELQSALEQKNISYTLLNGSDGSIQRKISEHKSGKVRVLCMNAKMMGAGLNLQHATDIILYHRQSDDLQKQIIGRAQRPGRNPEEPLRVWKLSYSMEYSNS